MKLAFAGQLAGMAMKRAAALLQGRGLWGAVAEATLPDARVWLDRQMHWMHRMRRMGWRR